MERMNQYLPAYQTQALRELRQRTDLSVAEWMRKMIDHCLQPKVLNELLPPMSGHLSIRREG